jgi:hypothetical protein
LAGQEESEMAATKPAAEPISVKPAANPKTGFVTVNVFDDIRQAVPPGVQILLTIRDGAQNELFRDFVNILAFADGHEQSGFQPVSIGPHAPGQLDLMLLPKNGTFHFAAARWTDILAQRVRFAEIFGASVTGDAGRSYEDLMEEHPGRLACLLNDTTAMQQISLPQIRR